ncbi:MAG: GNAT family N-acetyltransferase [Phormidesmis sp.]
MQLETDRLIIRHWQPTQDARYALDIYGDSRVMTWLGDDRDASVRQSERRLQRYVKQAHRGRGCWAVEQKDIGRVIGSVVLVDLPDLKADLKAAKPSLADGKAIAGGMPTDYVEIGWHFRPASWGVGYATEAAFCIAQYGFEELCLPVLLAVLAPSNRRSHAVAKHLGMRDEGVTTRYYRGQALLLCKLDLPGLKQAKANWSPQWHPPLQATGHCQLR